MVKGWTPLQVTAADKPVVEEGMESARWPRLESQTRQKGIRRCRHFVITFPVINTISLAGGDDAVGSNNHYESRDRIYYYRDGKDERGYLPF